MTSAEMVTGLAGFFHNLFTVIWVGGLVMIVLTLLPAARDALGGGPQLRGLMGAVLRRHRPWVYASMLGLFVTGILQARAAPDFSGLLRFDTPYSALTSLKHGLTAAMIVIALYRSQILAPRLEAAGPEGMKVGLQWVFVNAGLGVAVLLLSGLLAAL